MRSHFLIWGCGHGHVNIISADKKNNPSLNIYVTITPWQLNGKLKTLGKYAIRVMRE